MEFFFKSVTFLNTLSSNYQQNCIRKIFRRASFKQSCGFYSSSFSKAKISKTNCSLFFLLPRLTRSKTFLSLVLLLFKFLLVFWCSEKRGTGDFSIHPCVQELRRESQGNFRIIWTWGKIGNIVSLLSVDK